MRKELLILVVMMVGLVGASEVYNFGFTELNDFVAGDSSIVRLMFDFNDTEDNYNSQLVLKVSINSSDENYPVWREDFSLDASIIEDSFFALFGREVELECHEAIDVNLTVEELAVGDYHLVENGLNGTFYCYNEDTYLMNVDSMQELVLDLQSKQNVYPGTYGLAVELLELEPTDFTLFRTFYGQDSCSEENLWCRGADIDRNGVTNILDFLWFKSNYGRLDCSESNDWCDRCDLNKDGSVDSVYLFNPQVNVWRFNGSACNQYYVYSSEVLESDFMDEGSCLAMIQNETEEENNETEPVIVTATGGGGNTPGGSGITESCGEWSECVEGIQTEECIVNGLEVTNTRTCTVDVERNLLVNESVNSSETQGFTSLITGAVTGAMGSATTWIVGLIIVIVVGGLVFVWIKRTKN